MLAGTVVLAVSLLVSGCASPGRTVKMGSDSGFSANEEETTKKSKKLTDDEEETTKKSKKSDDEEETTKKSKKSDDEEETTKKSKKSDDEEETTKKKSSSNDIPAGWKSYSGTGYTISLDSSEWSKMTAPKGTELAFAHASTSSDGFKENINTVVQDTSAYDMDLEGYKDLSLEQYEQLGYDLVSIEPMTVDGQEGYYVITTTESNDMVCYIAQFFTMIDTDAYVLTFAANDYDFYSMEDDVLEIFEHVKFE